MTPKRVIGSRIEGDVSVGSLIARPFWKIWLSKYARELWSYTLYLTPQGRAYAEQIHPPITITDTDRLLKE
ncbi:MAG: hypothetical protein ACR2NI_01745 [Pirellulales bacterium]